MTVRRRRRRRQTTVVAAVLAALVAPGVAAAGGWATVGLDLPRDAARAGAPWRITLTVLQHGRTPLTGVEPEVTVRPAAGGRARSFAATPTSRPGVYAARVEFPAGGAWTVRVHDGFTASHAFDDVRVSPRVVSSAVGERPAAPWSWPWPALVAAAVAGLVASRLRAHPRPAPGG